MIGSVANIKYLSVDAMTIYIYVALIVIVVSSLTILIVGQIKHYKEKERQEQEKERQKQERDRQEQEKERKRQEFDLWIKNHGLQNCKEYGDFIFDADSLVWCKRGDYRLWNSFETKSASIKKEVVKRSTKTMLGYSRYIVSIETTDINCPIVTINCGCSDENAEKIKATVNIIRGIAKKATVK